MKCRCLVLHLASHIQSTFLAPDANSHAPFTFIDRMGNSCAAVYIFTFPFRETCLEGKTKKILVRFRQPMTECHETHSIDRHVHCIL